VTLYSPVNTQEHSRVAAACIIREDGSGRFLRKVDIFVLNYTVFIVEDLHLREELNCPTETEKNAD
jgi:hypothetical protein